MAPCPAGQYSTSGSSQCSPCRAGYFCAGSASTSDTNGTCAYGYACPAGSSNATTVKCGVGYFCPAGTGNASAVRCFAGDPATAAWWRDVAFVTGNSSGTGGGAGSATRTVLSSTAVGTLVMVNSSTGSDVSCNDGLARLPAVLMSPGNGVGVVGDLRWADVTGDGLPDVLALLANGSVVVAVNNGSGGFTNAAVVVVSANATALAVVDLNADNALDVLVFTSQPRSFALLNYGGGVNGTTTPALSSASLVPVTEAVARVVTVDVDGDGAVDVVTASRSGVTLFLSTNKAGFVNQTAARVVAPSLASPPCLAASDVDNDGDVDFFLCGGSGAGNQLWLNNGTGYFVDVGAGRGVAARSAATAALGDYDNDGNVDVVVNNGSGSTVLLNTGSAFVVNASWAGPGVPVLVDVNGDGGLDVPASGWLSPLSAAVGNRTLYVRLLGRNGGWNQCGASVCVRSAGSATVLSCRTFDCGGGSGGQPPYDVHVGLPLALAGGAVDVQATFVNGRTLDKRLCARFGGVAPASVRGGVLVLSDVPVVQALALAPAAALLKIGDALTLSITARFGEAGLVPSPAGCCLVHGVNVSSTFVDAGGGVYTVTYVVREGDGDVNSAAPTVAAGLADAKTPAAVSDGVDGSKLQGQYSALTIDATRPRAAFLGDVSWNGTVRPTNSESVSVSCDGAGTEALRGCSVYYLVTAAAVGVANAVPVVLTSASAAAAATATTAVVIVTAVDRSVIVLVVWGLDAAGNAGPNATLTWTVDSSAPVTLWPSPLPNYTNVDSVELTFGCSKTNCRFAYRLDNGGLLQAGGNSNGSLAASDNSVDTTATLLSRRLSSSTNATVRVTANATSNATIEVCVGGAVCIWARAAGYVPTITAWMRVVEHCVRICEGGCGCAGCVGCVSCRHHLAW